MGGFDLLREIAEENREAIEEADEQQRELARPGGSREDLPVDMWRALQRS